MGQSPIAAACARFGVGPPCVLVEAHRLTITHVHTACGALCVILLGDNALTSGRYTHMIGLRPIAIRPIFTLMSLLEQCLSNKPVAIHEGPLIIQATKQSSARREGTLWTT